MDRVWCNNDEPVRCGCVDIDGIDSEELTTLVKLWNREDVQPHVSLSHINAQYNGWYWNIKYLHENNRGQSCRPLLAYPRNISIRPDWKSVTVSVCTPEFGSKLYTLIHQTTNTYSDVCGLYMAPRAKAGNVMCMTIRSAQMTAIFDDPLPEMPWRQFQSSSMQNAEHGNVSTSLQGWQFEHE